MSNQLSEYTSPMRLRLLLLALLSMKAFGQDVSAPVVSGHPFSADEVIIYGQATNSVRLQQTVRVYRDSSGRTRSDISVPVNPPDPTCCPRLIGDPVSGFIYSIDSGKKVARRMFYATGPGQTLPTTDGGWKVPPLLTAADDFPEPSTKTEFLELQRIGGFMAEGWRITMVYAAAAGIGGRTRPAQERVEEKWYSEELQMMVLQQVHTTFSGDSTMRLENINRAEPDLLLFQVPPGYMIDEPESRTVKPK